MEARAPISGEAATTQRRWRPTGSNISGELSVEDNHPCYYGITFPGVFAGMSCKLLPDPPRPYGVIVDLVAPVRLWAAGAWSACCARAFEVTSTAIGVANATVVAASQNSLRREMIDLACSLMVIPLT
jgi:hypothetical protein